MRNVTDHMLAQAWLAAKDRRGRDHPIAQRAKEIIAEAKGRDDEQRRRRVALAMLEEIGPH